MRRFFYKSAVFQVNGIIFETCTGFLRRKELFDKKKSFQYLFLNMFSEYTIFHQTAGYISIGNPPQPVVLKIKLN